MRQEKERIYLDWARVCARLSSGIWARVLVESTAATEKIQAIRVLCTITKLSWNFTINNISITWAKDNVDTVTKDYFKLCLEMPI